MKRTLPVFNGNLQDWSRALTEYLRSTIEVQNFNSPQAVQLLGLTDDRVPSADSDGTIAFDPTGNQPVYSLSGEWVPFSSSISYNYNVNGSGDPATDINNMDFSGQDGASGTCAQVPPGTTVTFYHNGVQYAYTGPRPASYGSGCADTMLSSYLTPTGVGTFLALTDTPSVYPVAGSTNLYLKALPQPNGEVIFSQVTWGELAGIPGNVQPPYTLQNDITDEGDMAYVNNPANDFVYGRKGTAWTRPSEVDLLDLNRLRWRGDWIQQQYVKNDVVLGDGNWLMVANKDTTDVAPPRENPDSDAWDLPDSPSWTQQEFAGVVESGRIWTTTEPVTVVGYQVWVPELTNDTAYKVDVYIEPVGQPNQRKFIRFAEPVIVENGWATVAVQQTLVPASYNFAVVLNALNSGNSIQVTGGWTRGANSNTDAPTAQQWNTQNSQAVFRIDKTDLDGTDRTTELLGIIVGSTVTFVNTANTNQSMTWRVDAAPTDAGSYILFDNVSYEGDGPAGQPPTSATCTMTANVPVPANTKYVEQIGGNPTHTWGSSVGVLLHNGSVVTGRESDAFGVRVLTRTWTKSADWDVMSTIDTGAGGGGGVTTFEALSDTPIGYGNAGQFVKTDGTKIVFEDPAPGVVPSVYTFENRPAFVAWDQARTEDLSNGNIATITPSGLPFKNTYGIAFSYQKGANKISDLPDWVPFGDVYPDHFQWNERPSDADLANTTDMTAGVQAAIDYVQGLTPGSNEQGVSGVVNFLPERYRITTVAITRSGTVLKGPGRSTARLQTINDANLIEVRGTNQFNTDSPKWVEISDLLLLCGASEPTVACGIEAQRAVINIYNCEITDFFTGVAFYGVEESSRIDNTNISQGGNQTSVKNKSCAVALYAAEVDENDPVALPGDDGKFYAESNSVHITNCNFRTKDNGAADVLRVEAVDGLYATNNHFGFSSNSILLIAPRWSAVSCSNMIFTNVFFDPTSYPNNPYTVYGILVSNVYGLPTNVLRDVEVNNCIIGGPGFDGVRILTSIENFKLTDSIIKYTGRYAVFVDDAAARDINILGNTFWNTSFDFKDGWTPLTAPAVQLTNCTNAIVSNNNFSVGYRGIQLGAGANGTSIGINTYRGLSDAAIVLPSTPTTDTLIAPHTIPAGDTIASATNLIPPPGPDTFYVTGTSTIASIRSFESYNRDLTLIFESTATVTSTNNIRLDNNAQFNATAGATLSLRCRGGQWYETGRTS